MLALASPVLTILSRTRAPATQLLHLPIMCLPWHFVAGFFRCEDIVVCGLNSDFPQSSLQAFPIHLSTYLTFCLRLALIQPVIGDPRMSLLREMKEDPRLPAWRGVGCLSRHRLSYCYLVKPPTQNSSPGGGTSPGWLRRIELCVDRKNMETACGVIAGSLVGSHRKKKKQEPDGGEVKE